MEIIESKNDNKEIREILTNYIIKSKRIRFRLTGFFFYYIRSFVFLFFIICISLFIILFIQISGFTISRITVFFSIAVLLLSLTFHVETRLKNFKPNKLYKITFYFVTAKKVNYEISRHIST